MKNKEQDLIRVHANAEAEVRLALSSVDMAGRFIREAIRREREPGTGDPRLSWIAASREAKRLLEQVKQAAQYTEELTALIEEAKEKEESNER